MSDRLERLVHYIIWAVPPDKLGRTKLAKIMWFADVEHYRATGQTLTKSDKYRKRDNGPLHADFYSAIDSLKRAGVITERSSETWAGIRKELIWLQKPDVTDFNGQEIATLHSVIAQVSSMTAKEASDSSHGEPWWSAYDGELLPVAAAAVQFGDVDVDDMAWAEAVCDAVRPPV